jgi:SAM-dependent methyltransferase
VNPPLYDDAELYDLVHADYRDDLSFYRRLAADHGGPILELGAGSGRLTELLAVDGYQLTAVEPSAAMRRAGEARLAKGGLSGRVTWIDGDMRTLDLGARFPLIVAPFNTLMHLDTLDDQDAALERVEAHLEAGGLFACDVYAPRFTAGTSVHHATLRLEAGEAAQLTSYTEHDPLRQRTTVHHQLDLLASDGTLRRRSATLQQRSYHRFELERLLRSAGLGALRSFGDFQRGPIHEGSRVWVMLAGRRR